jgi:hypothetical protein
VECRSTTDIIGAAHPGVKKYFGLTLKTESAGPIIRAMSSKPVTVEVETALWKKVRDYSKRSGLRVTAIVRAALEAFLRGK